MPDPHHPLTHHRGNPEWIEKVTKVNTMHMELFAGFIGKLKETPDGDGTLLDHSIIVYGSGLSDGNRHTHEDLPGRWSSVAAAASAGAATSSTRKTRR